MRRPLVLVGLVILLGGGFAPAHAAELISRDAAGNALAGASAEPTISSDGKVVAFSSTTRASGLDRNNKRDVFVGSRTGAARAVSDDRGGDQPILAANGRHLVYRSLEDYPRLQIVDLDSPEPPRTVSFPAVPGVSFRYADNGVISADGRYVAFPFRSIPGLANDNTVDVFRVDNTVSNKVSAQAGVVVTDNLTIKTMDRVAMSFAGDRFFFETSESLTGSDQNSARDIYFTDGNNLSVVSAATVQQTPAEAAKGVRNVVCNRTGTLLFFISERRLVAGDNDGGPTIYRATFNGTPALEPIPTQGVVPFAISRQGIGDGQVLVFLGQSGGRSKPYALNLANRNLIALTSENGGVPVISADNSTIAFATPAALSPRDANGATDIYTVPNPFAATKLGKPSITLTRNPSGEITQPTSTNIAVSASSPNGAILYTELQLDGVRLNSTNGSTLPAANYAVPRGTHTLRAFTVDAAGVTFTSPAQTVIVKPPANFIFFRGVKNLQRRQLATGSQIQFSGSLEIDNTFPNERGPLRILLTEAANNAEWEFFTGDSGSPETRPEQTLAILAVPSVDSTQAQPSKPTAVPFRGITRPPEVVAENGFQGVGYTVLARLQQQQQNGTWADLHTITVFQVRPRLSELTPGPNGGTPVLDTPQSDSGFNPTQISSITIVGPQNVAAATSRTYVANGTFASANPATRPITPTWSIAANQGVSAFISPAGVLTVGNVSAPRALTLRATLGQTSGNFTVVVKPVTPAVSILLPSKTLVEVSSTPGKFRLLRSPAANEPLTVKYTIGGTANDPDRPGNPDYTALSGTAVIPAGKAAVDVLVTPGNDVAQEGNETVIMTLSPDGNYRLGNPSTRTLTIIDDEPVAPNQPDAVIRFGARPPVGENVFDFDPALQQFIRAGARDVPVVFTIDLVNRTNAPQDLTISNAGADFLGFTVQYLQGTTDVTAAVVNGTFTVPALQPGSTSTLKVRITPTAATPLQGLIQCPVTVQSGGANPRSDTVQAVVRRVR